MSSATNAALIDKFYTAFARRDAATMGACYADTARFRDPGFGDLDAAQVRAMWTMLLGRAADLRVTHRDVSATDDAGSAHWTAHYTFTKTGRKVVNEIDASFRFSNGLIVEHVDRFDFWRWSRQSLGPIGMLMGWSGALQRKVETEARAQLARYMAKQ
jgi:ketosteroid isomerase-like protein